MASDQVPSRIPPLRSLSPAEIGELTAAGTVRECAGDEILFQRGEIGDAMYVLEEGAVELIFVENGPGKVLRSGEVFGELAFILGRHPRTATARAMVPTRLRVMDARAVERLFAARPRLLLKLLRRTCEYLLASEDRLIADLRKKNQELVKTLDYLRRTKEEVGYQELLAHTDGLTGLYNRRCFDAQLGKFIARSEATGIAMTLILMDLDDFKAVNDALGHSTGDTVLRRVGEIITGSVRSSDLPCRFGGDEFAIVLTGIEAAKARERAEDVRRRVAAMPPVNSGSAIADAEMRVTASLGGTMFRHGEPPAELFDRADRQLYLAKAQGRNRVEWEGAGSLQAVASSAEK